MSVVDSLVELLISGTNDGVVVSMVFISVVSLLTVDISADVEDSVELDIVFKAVGEPVDSSDSMVRILMNVDISGDPDVFTSFSSVDDSLLSNNSEVVVMTLIALVDVDIIV